MKLGEYIIKYRREHNLSQRQFAKKCGNVSNGYISMIEADVNPQTGKSIVSSLDKLSSIAYGLDLSVDKLMQIIDDMPVSLDGEQSDIEPFLPQKMVLLPVLGRVKCGVNGLAEEEPEGYEPADVTNADEFFYLRATGNSMEPYIREGDYVLVHKQEDVESGDLAIVVVGGEEGTLKKVLKQSNSVILQPFNNNCPTRVFVGNECDELRVIGKVVETKHKW